MNKKGEIKKMSKEKKVNEIKNAIETLNKYCKPNSNFCENFCPIKDLCYCMFNEAPSEWIHEEEK